MSLSPRVFAAALGALAGLAGLIALVIPLSIRDGLDRVDCGSAISPQGGSALEELLCEDAVSSRRAWAWPLGIVGAVVLTGAALVARERGV